MGCRAVMLEKEKKKEDNRMDAEWAVGRRESPFFGAPGRGEWRRRAGCPKSMTSNWIEAWRERAEAISRRHATSRGMTGLSRTKQRPNRGRDG